MKQIYNPSVDRMLDEREKAFLIFRRIYYYLDAVIEGLYCPARYTLNQYDKLVDEYRDLQTRADRLEEHIRKRYPSPGIDQTIAWMKSFPFEDIYGNPVDTDKI